MSGVPVRARGLVHIYRGEDHDVAALSGVDLDVPAGQVLALLGPSGAGKSTLLMIFAGLMRPSAGSVRIGDRELSAAGERELDRMRGREVGVVLQDAARNVLPYLTPRQNVALARTATAGSGLAVDDALALVGMGDADRDRPCAVLDGAAQQLTALACAVAPNPGVLLADEPTSRLAADQTRVVVDALRSVNERLGTTIVVVTHDRALAAGMDRTVTIREGRVGGEGRDGVDVAVVGPDGSLPLPPHVLDRLPPGSLVRIEPLDAGDPAAGWRLVLHPVEEGR